MSGPKVVRVVTRDELAAQGAARLRRLDAAIAYWTEVCKRSADKEAAAAAIRAVVERRSVLERMLTEDRFADLERHAEIEQSFLRQDAVARIEQARRRGVPAVHKLLEDLEGSDGINIERLLAELTALGSDATPWSVRAAALVAQTPDRQAQLAGSLLEDLSQAVKAARARSAQTAALVQAAAGLSGDYSEAAQALGVRIQAALTAADVPDSEALVAEAGALAAQRQRTLAAEARRRVMLEGLARLGYEVNEGMETAWVQGGKVVLRNADHPGYAVELAGGSKSDRVHVRVVACGEAGSPHDAARDIDVETLWCAELEQLRSSVASTGGSIVIEQALPAGAAAVEVIEDGTERVAAAATTHARTLNA